jgi:uncharacterized phage protein (TIGR02218 family)
MTYDASEASIEGGEPIELYEFRRGSIVERYTSADSDVVVEGETYIAATLRRSDIDTSNERARSAVRITTARDFSIAELFRVSPPPSVVAFTLRRVHRSDLTDVAVIWVGRVLNAEWKGATADLNCEPVTTSMKRMGLRRKYQRQCPLVLYAQGEGQCNVNRDAHKTSTTVTGVSGLVLSVAALTSKPWAGGFVEWEAPDGSIEYRFIESFTGLDLKLSQAFQGIAASDPVTVSPGCNHTQAVCIATYANGDNYGGFPFTPVKNPFDGTPVY